ncbi:META domain-containing protein [Tenggerimyces flavus]|uniref:META domain-containing protein n=1 Tax=Tenggerimyces flavus TaxID=1708749 RepID=A0ABV7YAV6_9ACTN|nr:META domain-containing protein [Tenggerimyces flavus]MBM7785240.1 heat shock protein HslJ [Tenggerimyces flavus]
MKTHILLVAAVAAIASACGANAVVTSPPATDPAADLHGKTFLSTKVTVGGKNHALVEGTRISLSFEKTKLSALAGCNGVGGDVKLGNGVIDLTPGPSTLMACAPELMKQSEWFAKLLTSKPAWKFDDGTLTITADQTVLTFLDKKQAMPDIGLADSRWTLESIITGDTASSSAGASKAYLEFRDGKVSGFDGCNQLGGPAKVADGKVVLGQITSTLKACADGAEVGTAFGKVITQGTLTVVIDADRATLTTEDGKNGLVLRGSYGRPAR